MIVGNVRSFALEFELDVAAASDERTREWLFGRIRWWCGGDAVGRYEDDTTLRDVAIELMRFLRYTGTRQEPALLSASPHEVLRVLREAIFEDRGQSDEQVAIDEERYRRFIVTPLVDVFDDWDVFLIEGEKFERILWRRSTEEELRECVLERGEFAVVSRAFLVALSSAVAPYGGTPGIEQFPT